jgi:signal transduction histidine kinase/ActR/RegA family two-component response regulator
MGININNEIYAAQIRGAYQQTPMVLIVNVVNSALVALILGWYLEHTGWWIFFGLVVTLTGVRALVWRGYHRDKKPHRPIAIWAQLATLGSGLSGLLWGVGIASLVSDNLVEEMFLAFVIGGMCAGAVFSLSYHLPTFIAYVVPAVLPLSGHFFLDGRLVYSAMGGMLVVFVAAMTFAAYNFSHTFANGAQLNIDLTKRTKELVETNAQLAAEVRQRKAAEDQLLQAQKMEALGQLTGGIAHDFNNLLTAIIGNLEMAQSGTVIDPRMAGLLHAALNAAERGATLIRDLLTFAHRQSLHPREVDVSVVVDEAEKILKQTIGPDISLFIEADPGLEPAWVDPNQLQLAILNLVLNARDAMPSGGRVQISSKNRQAEAGTAPPELPPGEYVVVSVSDTGMGMSDETLARACEPFFTTKEIGCGSGLGLSMVQGFAVQSGGSIQIISTLREGTKVELWLPRAVGRATESTLPEAGASILRPGQARILVCDDDGDVRALVGALLRDNGYTVWEANNPALALQILKRERPIDLFLVDYAMPEMSGSAVIEQAQSSQPGLKVLLITGYPEALRTGGVSGIALLAKPFKVAELKSRVAEILHSATSPATEQAQATPDSEG